MEIRSAEWSRCRDLPPPDDDTRFLIARRMIQPGIPLKRPVSTSGPFRETTVPAETRYGRVSARELRCLSLLAPPGSWRFGSGTTSSGVAV